MNIWRKSNGSVPLIFEVQYNYTPVSGIVPTVEIRRNNDDKYIDFGTNTFVAGGGTKYKNMTEMPGRFGVYRYNFNPDTFGEKDKEQKYIMTYRATIPIGYAGAATDIELVQSEINYFTPFGSGITSIMSASFSE